MDSKEWKANYSTTLVLALISGIAYFTGPETAEWTKQVMDSYPQDRVEDHALWGRITFVIQGISGILGIMGWASILQEETPDKRIYKILISLLVANTLITLYTAHLGGFIRRMDLLL